MQLEWDEAKRQDTLRRRGLDFADVKDLDFDHSLTATDQRRDYAEMRFVTIGPIKGRLCVVAWCYRGINLRVISLRKANTREVRRYEREI